MEAMLTLLVHLAPNEHGAFHGRLEGIFAEKVDIGLWSRTDVVGVLDEVDSTQLACHDLILW